MKFLNRFVSILQGLKLSFKRFPITIGISTLLTISLIYLNENRFEMTTLVQENLMRFNMILGIAILLSLCIALLSENFFKENKTKSLLTYLGGTAILVFYYLFLLKKFEFVEMTRYAGTIIFLLLVFFYIPVIGNKDKNYEYRVLEIFGNFFETAIYSFVLVFGIFAIFFTIDNLFDANLTYKYYLYTFLIVFFVFAVSFFLSKLPQDGETFDRKQYSGSMRILLTYIVIPLITIYTIILYVYFAKILITWQWPKGLVSHLVIWYTALSIGVIFLITPLIETDKISRYFKFIFPKLVIPILLMMFVSIGQRISQYGITENRYYILVLGLWITLIMLYFSIKKPLKNIIIPISLSLVVLNSVLGPLSSYSISKYSQNRRLNSILDRNSMISGDSIVRNTNVSKEDQLEINNILHYFYSYHSLDDVKVLSDDFETSHMEDVFGFKYEPNVWGIPTNERYFYYGLNLMDKPIDIKGYEHYIQVASWNNDEIVLEDLKIIKNMDSFILSIERNDGTLISINTNEVALEIISKFGFDLDYEKDQKNPDEMSYETQQDGVKVKIVFTNISGAKIEENVELKNLEYILLIDDLSN
ncbi:MAG: DUF4153 domain-containing protein [Tissierellaceae bacterium]|nr:DUF4153 domain-containing protein [Tissierellaceae bacterium]